MKFSQPLEQFSIIVLTNFRLLFNINFSITIVLYTYLIFLLFLLITNYMPLIYSLFLGTNHDFFFIDFIWLVYSWLVRQLKSLHSRYYFILLIIIFIFIFCSNFLGLFAYNFTLTSQIFLTFWLSFFLFLGIIFLGLHIYKINFFHLFIPSGITSLSLLIFIILIEFVSYCIRPFSLAIRLFANMLAGHTLLHILGNFSFTLFLKHIVFVIFLSFSIIFCIFLLEIAIAFIQSYVFIVLIMIYLNDIYNLNH